RGQPLCCPRVGCAGNGLQFFCFFLLNRFPPSCRLLLLLFVLLHYPVNKCLQGPRDTGWLITAVGADHPDTRLVVEPKAIVVTTAVGSHQEERLPPLGKSISSARVTRSLLLVHADDLFGVQVERGQGIVEAASLFQFGCSC